MKTKILLALTAFFCGIYCARAQGGTLPLNGSSNGNISTVGQTDWWTVTTTQNGKLTITLINSGTSDFYAQLYASDQATALGNQIEAWSGDSHTATTTIDGLAPGSYKVKVYPFSTTTGTYTISDVFGPLSQANDAEPDDYAKKALTLAVNATKGGQLGYNNYAGSHDVSDWYKVTTTVSGALKVILKTNVGTNSTSADFYAKLYSADTTTVLGGAIESWNGTSNSATLTTDGLAAGTYFIQLYPFSTTFGTYTITDSLLVPSQSTDVEPDNFAAQAIALTVNNSKSGQLGYNNHFNSYDNTDWYKVTTTVNGELKLILKTNVGTHSTSADFYAKLFSADSTTSLGNGPVESWNGNGNSATLIADGLAAGTYYIQLFPYSTTFGTYTLTDSLITPSQTTDAEPNNYAKQAITLPLNSNQGGQLGYNNYFNSYDNADWYKVTTTSDGYLRLTLNTNVGTNSTGADFYVAVYDRDSTTQEGGTVESWSGTGNSATLKIDNLAKGLYYVKVFPFSTKFGTYKLSDSLFTYANDVEPNQYAKQATTIPSNRASGGHINFKGDGNVDLIDWWKINYTGKANGSMQLTFSILPELSDGSYGDAYFYVYRDTTAAALYSSEVWGNNNNVSTTLTALQQGYYYIKVIPFSNYASVYSIQNTYTQKLFAGITVQSYDSTFSCDSTNSITYKCTKSQAPYTVHLFRFGTQYATQSTRSTTAFDSLPAGIYWATAFADGATGNAFGTSDTVSIMEVASTLLTNSIKATQAKLNWAAVSCATYYTIQYQQNGSGQWTSVNVNSSATSFVLKGLTANTTYNWRIQAVDSVNGIADKSVFTNAVTFTTTASLIAGNSGSSDATASSNNKQVSVFPNPATNVLHVYFNTSNNHKPIAMQLKDINVKTIWSAQKIESLKTDIDVSRFANGMYLLEINSGDKALITEKVFINR